MAFILGILLMMLPGDTAAPIDVYQRVFAFVASDSSTAAFLACEARGDMRSLLRVADSIYTLDRFPFDSDEDAEALSVYHADMLRPLRAAFAPTLAQLSSPDPSRGILFFSFLEGSALLAEVFSFHADYHTYEEYCLSTHSLKFLFSVPPSGIPQLLGRRCLLR